MTLKRAIWILALVVVLGLVVALAVQTERVGRRDAEIARLELERSGWTTPSEKPPKVDDAPPGARPVAVVEGGVRYLPRPRESPGPVALPPPGGGAPHPSLPLGGGPRALPCDLEALSVDVRCRAEVIELAGVPAARLFVSGTILDPEGGRRDLPETKVGDQGLGFESEPPDVRIDLPTAKNRRDWYAALRGGVIVPSGGWWAGGSWGKGHFGIAADYWKTPGDDQIAVGAEIRF